MAFFESCYLQCLKNPQIPSIPAYGRDKTASELLDMPSVAKYLDYEGLCCELKTVFGADSLFVFAYTPNIIAEICNLLNTPPSDEPEIRENVTVLNEAGVSVLKVINRYPLDWKEKNEAYHLAARIGALIGDRSEVFTLTEAECARIRDMCSMKQQTLLQFSHRSFERWMAMGYGSNP